MNSICKAIPKTMYKKYTRGVIRESPRKNNNEKKEKYT